MAAPGGTSGSCRGPGPCEGGTVKNRSGSHWQLVLTAAPVVLVNIVAFSGQLAFLRDHLSWVPAGQVLMAVTLEVIAVYLAWQAHLAQLANDSALRLRLAAYGFALLIAAMNYSHYAGPGWAPKFVAVAVALCSVASPWLWGVHTRRASRDELLKLKLIEPHALRLGGTRWAWHPYRSGRVMWAATWQGTTDPVAAIGALYPSRASVAASAGASVKLPLPSHREIQSRRGCGQRAAEVARAEVQLDRRGRGGVTQPAPVPAAYERSRGGGASSPRAVPAAQVPAGDAVTPAAVTPAPAGTSNGQARHG